MKTRHTKKIKLTFFDGSVASFDRPADTPIDVVEARQCGEILEGWQFLDARRQVCAGPLVPNDTFWEAFVELTKWRAHQAPAIKTMKAIQQLRRSWDALGDTENPDAWSDTAAHWTARLLEIWYETRQDVADEAGHFIFSTSSGNYDATPLRESTGPKDKCITDALGMENGDYPGFLIDEENLAEKGFKVCVLGKPISLLEAAVRKAGFSVELYNKEVRSINTWFKEAGQDTRLPLIRRSPIRRSPKRLLDGA